MANRNRPQERRTKPLNNFQLLVRAFSKYIKTCHHLRHVNSCPSTPVPRGIDKLQQSITTNIHPLRSTSATNLKIKYNGTNWAFTTIQILEEHYQLLKGSTKTEISGLEEEDWEVALQVATTWVKRDIRHIKPDTLTTAIQDLREMMNAVSTPKQGETSMSNQNTNTMINITKRKLKVTEKNTLAQEDGIHKKRRREDHCTHNINKNLTQSTDQEKGGTDGVQDDWETNQNDWTDDVTFDIGPSPEENQPDEHVGEMMEVEQDLGDPGTTKLPEMIDSDLEHELIELFDSQDEEMDTGENTVDNEPKPGDGEGNKEPMSAPKPPIATPLPQRLNRRLWGTPTKTGDQRAETLTTEKSKGLFTVHDHHDDKIKNWTLTPERQIMIIGDSNMRRLPEILDDRVQVDCYPGANISHATHLFKYKTPTTETVSMVILSFGINNRRKSNPSLLKNELRSMLNAAADTFPQAQILMPVINFSERLPGFMRTNLSTLNYLIRETGKQIPRLEKKLFATDPDGIHWTHLTGKHMWNHWKSFLE